MVEAHARHVHVPGQVEEKGDFGNVAPVHGEAKAHFDPLGQTVLDALDGLLERALHSPEFVVYGFAAVQGHPHVGQADLL